jgi:hypothetical protein
MGKSRIKRSKANPSKKMEIEERRSTHKSSIELTDNNLESEV